MRVFLDANIIFSAAWSETSPANLLFRLAQHGHGQLYSSAFALEEARRNLSLKRATRLQSLDKLQTSLTLSPEPGPEKLTQAAAYGLPDKDLPILAAALVAKADVLVTGDKTHFGHLFGKKAAGVRILTLADILDRLASDKPYNRL